MADDVLVGMMGPLMGLLLGFLVFFIVLVIAIYIYMALALMKIANKTGTGNAWLAWIPVANIYLMTPIGGLPGWYTFGILLSFIPVFGTLLFLILFAYIWWKIAESISKPGWWGILMLIPIVNLVIIGMMAWGGNSAQKVSGKKKK